MSLLLGNNLAKVFGAEEIFSGISVEIPHKARIALVGPNGAGKTTLISLLVGLDTPTEGTISLAKGSRVAYLPQRPELAGSHTLWEEQLQGFHLLRQVESRLAELALAMADPDEHDAAALEYARLEPEFERNGGYTYETRIKMVLTGVGFTEVDYQTPLNKLSGGQKTRAMLARLLLEAPDLLVLDEPTNHLDIGAVEWLEDFLQSFPGAVLAISHDRYFIDHFASTVWELEFGLLETYRGNYTHYMRQREERRERLQKEYEAQQEYLAKEMEYIRRHTGSQNNAQAKGRLKRLETMKKRGRIISRGPQDRRKMRLLMVADNRSGDKVISTETLKVGYPDDVTPLFIVPDVTVYRGETVAIIGPNGAGKSTLLKTIIGELTPKDGKSLLGANVQVGYFAQAHESLNPNNTLIDEITTIKPMPNSEARNVLGAFLFSGDDVFRTIGTLSGGERGRVALAKLSLMGANLLLLDEPTNHLDIDSQEILQEVLEAFNGTVMLVSHDRYLISQLATQIWSVTPVSKNGANGTLEVYDGTYEEYVSARNQRQLSEQSDNTSKPRKQAAQYAEKKQGMNPYQLKKRIEELEHKIATLEKKQSDLLKKMEQEGTKGNSDLVRQLGEQYTQTETELNTTLDEWALLAE
jgi:ATP-binding cassette, subfamily F, member 3